LGKVSIHFLKHVNWQPTPPGSLILKEGEVHVYRINIAANMHALQAFYATLNPGETERGNKYFQQKDRHRFIISRGAQRNILARYLNKPPAHIQFGIGTNKKPYLAGINGPCMQYNITHAGQWVMLAVTNADVGADVEYIDPAFMYRDILEEHFNAAEIAFINAQDSVARFFKLWTRKEALLKATGQGLGEHLKITASLDGEHILPNALLGAEKNWQVSSFDLPDGYIASIATWNSNCQLIFFDISF
jgi:4'-phosphopantetheinyl transferase